MKRVVVTGLGAVTPVGNTVNDTWNNLLDGVCGIDFITRFDTADLKVKIAAEVKDFDPLVAMDKNDIRKTDLFTQYALVAAAEAMADAGLNACADEATDATVNIDPTRLGTYIGSGIGGIETFVEQVNVFNDKGPHRVSPFFIPKEIINLASGKVAIDHNAQGPCLPVVTACATGTHAIGEAFRAIAVGAADAIIAGGTEASITPLGIAGFTSCQALSLRNDPLNSSTPFDAERDGFVMGEGAGIVILEELEHALARGANIYAEIVGYGNTCDAYHITAPAPDGAGGARAIRLAADQGGLIDETKIYINPHGTSTPLNDKTETLAIKTAFGAKAYDMYCSSTKSMTGHTLGAAGGIEAVVAVKALQTGDVPPTIGYTNPDPECDLNYVPNEAIRGVELEASLSISLGFGGHNAAIAFRAYRD